MKCINIAVRKSTPLHVCFADPQVAEDHFDRFASWLSSAEDGHLVYIEHDGYRVGLLKRDFRSVELGPFDEDDDDGRTLHPSSAPDASVDPRATAVIPISCESLPRQLESELAELVRAATR